MLTSDEVQKDTFSPIEALQTVVVPRKLRKKFRDITLRYNWFPERLRAALEFLRSNPLGGSVEFRNGRSFYSILIAHYKLYYDVKVNQIELLDIEAVFHTW